MLWQSLYAGKGSIQGALDITPGVAPGFTDSTLAGSNINWTRPSGTGRIYAAGFTDSLLNAVGGRYIAPSAAQIVMGCDEQAKNARLEFVEGGVPTGAIGFPPLSPNVELRIKPGGTDLVQTVPNVRSTSVTITPSTGLSTGSYTLNDPNAATGKIEPRTASFTGSHRSNRRRPHGLRLVSARRVFQSRWIAEDDDHHFENALGPGVADQAVRMQEVSVLNGTDPTPRGQQKAVCFVLPQDIGIT